jgi:hypothetical protein
MTVAARALPLIAAVVALGGCSPAQQPAAVQTAEAAPAQVAQPTPAEPREAHQDRAPPLVMQEVIGTLQRGGIAIRGAEVLDDLGCARNDRAGAPARPVWDVCARPDGSIRRISIMTAGDERGDLLEANVRAMAALIAPTATPDALKPLVAQARASLAANAEAMLCPAPDACFAIRPITPNYTLQALPAPPTRAAAP